jgi:release factor glutamine methyltransferase
VTLAHVVERLVAAGCVAADEEARFLVGNAPDATTLEGWVVRRERGEPPAWITGTVEFAGRPLYIEPGVYVPRPQTVELAKRAARVLPTGGRAVDLCTGSGAVGAHLRAEVPTASVVGVDMDVRAARCAARNGVPCVAGDLGAPVHGDAGFDVVTAVAPYVPTADLALLPSDVQRYEPRRALDGGDDGLAVVRRGIADAARLLRTDGWLLIEIGGTQDEDVARDLVDHGFGVTESWRDDDGELRGIAAQRVSARGR